MKVIVNLQLRAGSDSKSLHKHFDTELIPQVGAHFEDSAFDGGDTKEITQVTCSFDENYYYVETNILTFDNSAQMNEFFEMCKTHDWE